MDEDGCGSSGVWNICSEITIGNVVFQFLTGITFKWDYVIGRSVALGMD